MSEFWVQKELHDILPRNWWTYCLWFKRWDSPDFALWKDIKSGEPSWDSLWGFSILGWHTGFNLMNSYYLSFKIWCSWLRHLHSLNPKVPVLQESDSYSSKMNENLQKNTKWAGIISFYSSVICVVVELEEKGRRWHALSLFIGFTPLRYRAIARDSNYWFSLYISDKSTNVSFYTLLVTTMTTLSNHATHQTIFAFIFLSYPLLSPTYTTQYD